MVLKTADEDEQTENMPMLKDHVAEGAGAQDPSKAGGAHCLEAEEEHSMGGPSTSFFKSSTSESNDEIVVENYEDEG